MCLALVLLLARCLEELLQIEPVGDGAFGCLFSTYHAFTLLFDFGLINHSNVPTGGAVAALVLFFLRLDSADKADRQLPLRLKVRRMDPLGIVLLVGAVCCMFLALQFGGETYPWRSSRVIGLFIGFCFILSFFCVLQWRLGEDATIPLRFIRQRTVFWGSLFLFCDDISNYVVSTLGVFIETIIAEAKLNNRNYITYPSISKPFEEHRQQEAASTTYL